MSFSITSREVEGVYVLSIEGRLSISDPGLQPLLNEHISNGRLSFVVDLAEVSYLDSYGLGDLINAYNLVKKAGGKINIARPRPYVKKLLNMTLHDVFEVFDDETEAVRAAKL